MTIACRVLELILMLYFVGTTRYYDDPDRPRMAGEHDAHLKTTFGGLILVPTLRCGCAGLPSDLPTN